MDQRTLLDEALERGIITDEQRKQLAEVENAERGDNDERIKPVGSFNEIFVTVGLVLLLSAASGLVGYVLAEGMYSSFISAAMSWFAAAYFHEGKRFRLPVIYGVFSAASCIGLGIAMGLSGRDDFFSNNVPLWANIVPMVAALSVLIAGTARFRTPFIMLLIGILFTVIVTYAAKYSDNDISYKLLLGGSGLVILATAIWFDLKDPKRVMRWSDYAFWSYVVGSPLFVHSLFLSVLIDTDRAFEMGGYWLVVAGLALIVSFVGVLLNRRALILSTLLYVGFVIFRMVAAVALAGGAEILLITVLIIGLYVIALGSRWTRVRRWIMSRLPQWKWLSRLPPY